MSNPLYASVLPVLRNLPANFPRDPLLPGLKRRPVNLWPLFLLIAFVVFASTAFWQSANSASTAEPSPARDAATGRVMQVERVNDSARGAAQPTFIKYRFMANNRLFYGNEFAQKSDEIPNVGDQISVSYAPQNPSDNYRDVTLPNGNLENILTNLAWIFVPIVLLFWLIFMFFVLSPLSPRDIMNWRRARGLYRNGELAAGRVQFVRNSAALRSPNARAAYEIVATYSVEGVRHLVATRCDNLWLLQQLAPETEVVVAHDALKPERAVILEPFAF